MEGHCVGDLRQADRGDDPIEDAFIIDKEVARQQMNSASTGSQESVKKRMAVN